MARFVRWLAIAAVAISGCSQMNYEKIPEAEVNQTEKAAAEAWATQTLTSWAQDQYPAPGNELSEAMKPGQSEARQKETDKRLEPIAGDFKTMAYFETRKSKPAKFVIYRFKGAFSKEDVMEIRMVYDLQGKIDGFWIKPWLNSMQ
jgi:hypothetical protein